MFLKTLKSKTEIDALALSNARIATYSEGVTRIHFIGINGVGINALARFARDMGFEVSGSDAHIGSLSNSFKGALVYEGVDPNVAATSDLVVYTAAVGEDHPELAAARERGVPTAPRQSFLGAVSRLFDFSAGVAGTHGKTTVTSMLAHILHDAGKSFVGMIGGESVDFANYVNNIGGARPEVDDQCDNERGSRIADRSLLEYERIKNGSYCGEANEDSPQWASQSEGKKKSLCDGANGIDDILFRILSPCAEKCKGSFFLTEACEYKRSFLSLAPRVGIALNAEWDHPDCYKSADDVREAFKQYLDRSEIKVVPRELLPLALGNGDGKYFCSSNVNGGRRNGYESRTNSANVQLPTAGELENGANGEGSVSGYADAKLSREMGEDKTDISEYAYIVENGEIYLLRADVDGDGADIYDGEKFAGRICLKDGGRYNFGNALFAIAGAKALGVSAEFSANSLNSFKGVKRRFESAGNVRGVPVRFDFAHHPTEIRCVLKRAGEYGRTLVVFQPHTFSRTEAYFDDFVEALGGCESVGSVVLMSAYAAREDVGAGLNSDALYEGIKQKYPKRDVRLARDRAEVLRMVDELASSHDIALFLGAGDIYALKENFVEK